MSVYGESAYGEVPYGGLAGSSGPLAVLYGESITVGEGREDSQYINFPAVGAITVTDSTEHTDGWYYNIIQGITASSAIQVANSIVKDESILLSSAFSVSVAGFVEILEPLTVEAKSLIATHAIVGEQIDVSTALAYSEAIHLADTLVLSGVVQTHLQAVQLISQAIAVVSTAGFVDEYRFSDTIELTASILANFMLMESAIENVTVTDDAVGAVTLVSVVNEDIQVDSSLSIAQQLQQLIAEQIAVSVNIRLAADVFAAWLVNPETSAMSRYDNFPFNSLAESGGRYYGAADDGIYLLEGDDDAGTNITASIKTALSNLGERRQKRINDVFLGVMTSGDMVLKVTADIGGERNEYWYDVVHHGDADNHRVKVGKGLKGTYWSFELVNKDGADFDIDNLQLYPLTLSRRV